MVVVGLAYREADLSANAAGGTPYGASHHAGARANPPSAVAAPKTNTVPRTR